MRSLTIVRCSLLAWVASILLFAESSRGDDWPQWRGPEGNGVSRETGLPVAWGENSNVAWKCPLPEWGTSTPAIWKDAIFVTSHADDRQLVLVRIDKKTGKIVWQRQVGEGSAPRAAPNKKTEGARGHQKFHNNQNLASPSPVTDGEVVAVHFGNGDLAAYDFDGKQLWRRNLQKEHGEYTIWWGHANSPVLYGDLVISVCMQDTLVDLGKPAAPSYVIAHDKRTGAEKWKTMRPTEAPDEAGDSYTTPVFWRNGDRTEMIVWGGQILDSYDPTTGKRLWYLPGLGGTRVITGHVLADGVAYLTQGKREPMLAVKLGGQGQLAKDAILWEYSGPTADSPTPVVCHALVFFVTDNGIAKCLDAKTGKLHWEQRLKGNYRASPLAAEGRIYFLSMKGLTTVVAASDRFERLAENQVDDDTLASPIASDGHIFLRGQKALYCVGLLAK